MSKTRKISRQQSLAQIRPRRLLSTFRRTLALVCCLLVGLSLVARGADNSPQDRVLLAAADKEKPRDPAKGEAAKVSGVQGRLIRVPLPLAGNADQRVKSMIQRAVDRFQPSDERPVIVLEFSSGQAGSGEGSIYSRAFELAQFLSSKELANVKTVAYIPKALKGHAVLAAMGCEEIVMAADAEMGEAGIDLPADEPIQPAILSGYRQIADRRHTIPPQVALGMLDKSLEVVKVKTLVSVDYVLSSELEELKKKTQVLEEEVLFRPGDFGRFSGRDGRELGFVKFLTNDRAQLAKALELPETALEEDPSLGGDWIPVQVTVEGEIRPVLISRLKSMIDDQLVGGEVNMLVVRVNSPGGSLSDSIQLATFLATIPRDSVRTVAYIGKEASGDAALIAMACHDVVMHPTAKLGGPGVHAMPADEVHASLVTIRDVIAKDSNRSWSLVAALVDPDVKVHRYQNTKTGLVDYFTRDEWKEQNDSENWQQGDLVTPPVGVLDVDGTRAKELNLADDTVENFDELKQLYGLENDPRLVEPNWADILIEALARDDVAAGLLTIAFISLIIELHVPGIGIGGFVAALCFLLFFWAKHLNGTADWLEVLLFFAGAISLMLEIFVLPGFGIFGLGGGLLIIASLVLASQTFVMPHSAAEYDQLRESLTVVGAAGILTIVGMMIIRRYLPNLPLFNQIMLPAPVGEAAEELSARESMGHYEHLLGEIGVTTTRLVPAGKARFGEELIDVTCESDLIDRGSKVEVVSVRGTRVVVKAVV